MRFTCTVYLGGNINHSVTNKGPVTVAEIAVLRKIHGETDGVKDIRPFSGPDLNEDGEPYVYDESAERARLQKVYGSALPGQDGVSVVEQLFGPMSTLPTKLSEIGINPRATAAAARAAAQAMLEQADALEAVADEPELEDEDAFFAPEPAPDAKSKKAA